MRGSNLITHRPYIPLNHPEWKKNPYIVRLAPGEGCFELEWLGGSGKITLHIIHPEGKETVYPMTGPLFSLSGLENDREYALYLTDEEGHRSFTRRLIPNPVPEGATVINYLHPTDDQYAFSGHFICSPSLSRLPDGRLVAGMDVFGGMQGQVTEILFRSEDDGKTWRYLCDLYPFYWGSLFTHRGRLYMLGLTTEYGNLQITRSDDGGENWTAPVTLFYGANVLSANGGMHRAPMHIIEDNGRLYTTCEYGSWQSGSHRPAVISVDADADLLNPEAWQCTGFLPFEGEWAEASGGQQGDTMEGNLLRTPQGKMAEILRYRQGEVLILDYAPEKPEALLKFNRIARWPVSSSMFRVYPYKGAYYLVTNRATALSLKLGKGMYRNVLSVFRSCDLENWEFVRDIVNRETEDSHLIGFQYPAVLWEEDGIRMNVRSGFNHAENAHNSNYMLFWHIEV